MPRDRRIVDKGLLKKGFVKSERDHTYYTFHTTSGVKTSVFTKVSHGAREISDNLLSKMSRQVRLSRSEFDELIDCTISRHDYEQKLILSGSITVAVEPD